MVASVRLPSTSALILLLLCQGSRRPSTYSIQTPPTVLSHLEPTALSASPWSFCCFQINIVYNVLKRLRTTNCRKCHVWDLGPVSACAIVCFALVFGFKSLLCRPRLPPSPLLPSIPILKSSRICTHETFSNNLVLGSSFEHNFP